MAVELLRFPHKHLRAQVIKAYMAECGYSKAVCFSCGNAARALEVVGVDTLHIGPHGVLAPQKWFTQAEIKHNFPQHFDATSGHLPVELMARLGATYRDYIGPLTGSIYVPSGSGETLVALKMANPGTNFIAVYNLDEATEYSEYAPLNALVRLLAAGVVFADESDNWG